MRIPREVEKMFCSDPVAERGINITQTEEDKVKHSDSHFLCISPSSEGLGWGGVGKCREERAMEALRGGPPPDTGAGAHLHRPAGLHVLRPWESPGGIRL